MTPSDAADVVVLGMGVGGELLAEQLADAGLDVVGVEARLLGGECPYWGCVPTKMMTRAANALAEARRVPELAGSASEHPDWAPVAARIRNEATDTWDDAVAVERFEGKGGRFVRGTGRLDGPGRVRVDDRVFEARRGVVLATGTRPAVPPLPGLDGVEFWTNREAVEAKEMPASLVVLGGGAVGLELGQVFARFGSKVTLVEQGERVLPSEEPEACEVVAQVFGKEGIHVHMGVGARSVARTGAGVEVTLDDDTRVTAERLLVATGRRTDLRPLGVASVGLDENAHAVPVDERLRAADRLWAIGDVTGLGPFTHIAVYQARIAAADILGEPTPPADYRALPRVTFTDPEVGAVGLTEQQARDEGIDVRVGFALLPTSARGWIHKVGNEGFFKLVEDRRRGVLVGATSVGPHGGETLGLLTLAVHAQIPVEQLRWMIYAYPTFHRGIEDALRDLPR
ncbi:MAG TPA: NAD(P)/FAD-dependent oxidoreductase [Acidimicrobiia bacterium]|nr:NAD(P)/FAD-dependent oxidoreductase [Acidimicrobiia bacterium]